MCTCHFCSIGRRDNTADHASVRRLGAWSSHPWKTPINALKLATLELGQAAPGKHRSLTDTCHLGARSSYPWKIPINWSHTTHRDRKARQTVLRHHQLQIVSHIISHNCTTPRKTNAHFYFPSLLSQTNSPNSLLQLFSRGWLAGESSHQKEKLTSGCP